MTSFPEKFLPNHNIHCSFNVPFLCNLNFMPKTQISNGTIDRTVKYLIGLFFDKFPLVPISIAESIIRRTLSKFYYFKFYIPHYHLTGAQPGKVVEAYMFDELGLQNFNSHVELGISHFIKNTMYILCTFSSKTPQMKYFSAEGTLTENLSLSVSEGKSCEKPNWLIVKIDMERSHCMKIMNKYISKYMTDEYTRLRNIMRNGKMLHNFEMVNNPDTDDLSNFNLTDSD